MLLRAIFSPTTACECGSRLAAAAAMPFIIDVREASEGQTSGSIEGSVSIPIRSLAKSLAKLPKDKISAKA